VDGERVDDLVQRRAYAGERSYCGPEAYCDEEDGAGEDYGGEFDVSRCGLCIGRRACLLPEIPKVEECKGERDDSSVDAYIGEQREEDRHQNWARRLLAVDVGDQESENWKKNVAACYDGVLIGEKECEGKQSAQEKGKWSVAQEDIDARGCNGRGEPVEERIADVEMGGRPEEEVPERGVALVAQRVEEKLVEAEVAGEQPGLGFVFPWLVEGNEDAEHGYIGDEDAKVSRLEPQSGGSSVGHKIAFYLTVVGVTEVVCDACGYCPPL
jgi:hypothetical protein